MEKAGELAWRVVDLYLGGQRSRRKKRPGCLLILPCRIDDAVFPEGCERSQSCNDCRHEYWLQEVPDHE